jgi:hypothetical protein
MKDMIANCSKVIDDVPDALKAVNNVDLLILVYMMCSKKFKDCKHNAMAQFYEQMKNDKNGPPPPKPEDMQKHMQEKLVLICIIRISVSLLKKIPFSIGLWSKSS